MKCHCFISYAREDAAVAEALQAFLESYRITRRLVPAGVPLPDGRYLRKVFVDTHDLSTVTDDFRKELRRNLDEAEYLIVLCSRHSACAGSFVHQEIGWFLEKRGSDTSRILPVALDGVAEDAVPDELQKVVASRNIVLLERDWLTDRIRRAQLQNAYFHVVEFLLKIDANVLNNRYWQIFEKRLYAGIMVGLGVAVVLVGMLAFGLHHAKVAEAHQRERVRFEKKVFPLSIDYSYVQAFAAPLFNCRTNAECVLIAAMPRNYAELAHKPAQKMETVAHDLDELGWQIVPRKYPVPNRRPLVTYELLRHGKPIPGKEIYLDVVSQLSAVRKVLDHLTSDSQFHPPESREELTRAYIAEFEALLPQLLVEEVGPRGTNVFYVVDKAELKAVLRGMCGDGR